MIDTERLDEVARGLRTHCTRISGAHFGAKEDSVLHRMIAHGLDLATDAKSVVGMFGVDLPLRAPSGDEYLSQFATTLGMEVSEPRAWQAPASAATRLYVDAHECQHVIQHRQGVDAGWWPKVTSHSVLYLAGVLLHSKPGEEYVGKVEADAYAVSETVRLFFAGTPGPIEQCAARITESYNLLDVGPTMALAILRSHYATFAAGSIPPITMAREAWAWLNANAADCKGQVNL